MNIRLDSFLAKYGLASRRKAKELIAQGKVTINGKVITEVTKIDPEVDTVLVNNRLVDVKTHKFRYILFNKPLNVVSTTSDDWGRPTVLDYVKVPEKVFPVGRLDYNSEGLMLLTNDGELALKLTHPRYHVPKTYIVKTKQSIKPAQLEQLRKGVHIYDTITLPAKVRPLGDKSFEIVLTQGLKRQIKEMCKAVELTVVSLTRVCIGPICLGNLRPGEFRDLTDQEINLLR